MEVLRWPTQGLVKPAPDGWEILMLYSLGGQANDLYRSDNASLWFPWGIDEKLFNTGAYIVNRAGMKKARPCLWQLRPGRLGLSRALAHLRAWMSD